MIDIATRERERGGACVMRENHFSSRTGKTRGNQSVGKYELDRARLVDGAYCVRTCVRAGNVIRGREIRVSR